MAIWWDNVKMKKSDDLVNLNSSKNLVAISDSFLGLARTLKIRAWDCKELAENALALIKY